MELRKFGYVKPYKAPIHVIAEAVSVIIQSYNFFIENKSGLRKKTKLNLKHLKPTLTSMGVSFLSLQKHIKESKKSPAQNKRQSSFFLGLLKFMYEGTNQSLHREKIINDNQVDRKTEDSGNGGGHRKENHTADHLQQRSTQVKMPSGGQKTHKAGQVKNTKKDNNPEKKLSEKQLKKKILRKCERLEIQAETHREEERLQKLMAKKLKEEKKERLMKREKEQKKLRAQEIRKKLRKMYAKKKNDREENEMKMEEGEFEETLEDIQLKEEEEVRTDDRGKGTLKIILQKTADGHYRVKELLISDRPMNQIFMM